MTARLLFPALLAAALLAGCSTAPQLPQAPANTRAVAAAHQKTDSQRQQLELIPPPSKSRYMAVHSVEAWENPYLTIQPDMVTVHVLLADANPSADGVGGLLRPVGARRQELNVSLDKLGDALSAIPRSAWPYGRVAAIEEAHKVPAAGEPQVRRNFEAALKTLNDVGIVAYEWNETGPK